MPRQYDRSGPKTSTEVLMKNLDEINLNSEYTKSTKEILEFLNRPNPLSSLCLDPLPLIESHQIVKLIFILKMIQLGLDKAISNNQRRMIEQVLKKIISSVEYKKIIHSNSSFSMLVEFITALGQIASKLPTPVSQQWLKQEALTRFTESISIHFTPHLMESYYQHAGPKHHEFKMVINSAALTLSPQGKAGLHEAYYRYTTELIDRDILLTELEYVADLIIHDSNLFTTDNQRQQCVRLLMKEIQHLHGKISTIPVITLHEASFSNALFHASLTVAEILSPHLNQEQVDWFKTAKLYNSRSYDISNGYGRALKEMVRRHPGQTATTVLFASLSMFALVSRLFNLMNEDTPEDSDNYYYVSNEMYIFHSFSLWLTTRHFIRNYPDNLDIGKIPEAIPNDGEVILPAWVLEFKEKPLTVILPTVSKPVVPKTEAQSTKPIIDWKSIDEQRKAQIKKAYHDYKKLLEGTQPQAESLFNTKNASKKSEINRIYIQLMESIDDYFEGTSITANTNKLHEDLLVLWNGLLSHGEKKISAPVPVAKPIVDEESDGEDEIEIQAPKILKQKNPMPKIRPEPVESNGLSSSSSTAKPLKPSQDPNEIHHKRIAKIRRDYAQSKLITFNPASLLAVKYDLLELCQRTLVISRVTDKDNPHHPVLVLRHGLVHHDLDIDMETKFEEYLRLLKHCDPLEIAPKTELMQRFDAQYTVWYNDKYVLKLDKADLKNKQELGSELQENLFHRCATIGEYYNLYLETTADRDLSEMHRKAYLMAMIEVGEILQQLINAKQDLSIIMPFDVVLAFTEFRTTSCHLLDNPSHETLGKIMNMIESMRSVSSSSRALNFQ